MEKKLSSINPFNNEVIDNYRQHDLDEIQSIINNSSIAYNNWKRKSVEDRIKILSTVKDDLNRNLDSYANLITLEMGKPIIESILEIKKCISLCEYYFLNGAEFLKPEVLDFESKKSFLRFDPIGIVFGIMPWNFPFWQVFRFAIPTLISGNTVLLKHASNVQGISILIDKIFNKNSENDIFKSLIIDSKLVSNIISNKNISAVSFTGSEVAGSKVAECCGKNIKKTVLELGGSDPFIVLQDANLNKCIDGAIMSRMINNGQSCIAAKRFIVHEKVYDEFVIKLKKRLNKLIIGDPRDTKTQVGPLANENILIDLDKQVQKSKKMGASVIMGGSKLDRSGYFYSPTIITNVLKDMPIYKEETFGPVFTIIKAQNINDIIKIANDSEYGLGGSIWSENIEEASELSTKIETGCIFINGFTRSDPKLPFGGIKKSGYGKELSKYGIREFVNMKTVVID